MLEYTSIEIPVLTSLQHSSRSVQIHSEPIFFLDTSCFLWISACTVRSISLRVQYCTYLNPARVSCFQDLQITHEGGPFQSA
jgi:hypothetical protein